MKSINRYLPIALFIGFLFVSLVAFMNSKPTPKDKRVYKIIKEYSPYYLDKRFGGLRILSKKDKDFKEKPSNMELFHRLEFLEKEWGKKHLKLKGDELTILDDNNKTIKTLKLQESKEINFVKSYYGVK